MEVYAIAEAVKALPRNGKLSLEQRTMGLTAVVARLYSLKGMGGDARTIEPEIRLAVQELEREVSLKYPFMTMAEIKYALEAGVKGELDDQPAYLNVANYCRWLHEYRTSAARLEAVQAVENDVRLTKPANLLDAGTVASRNEASNEKLARELFEEDIVPAGKFSARRIDASCACVYDYLRAAGRMEKPTAQEIQAAFSEAAKLVREGETADRTRLRVKRILLERFMQARRPLKSESHES